MLTLSGGAGWHVLGLIYRSDKNYEEASKCYRSALRIDTVRMPTLSPLRAPNALCLLL